MLLLLENLRIDPFMYLCMYKSMQLYDWERVQVPVGVLLFLFLLHISEFYQFPGVLVLSPFESYFYSVCL